MVQMRLSGTVYWCRFCKDHFHTDAFSMLKGHGPSVRKGNDFVFLTEAGRLQAEGHRQL